MRLFLSGLGPLLAEQSKEKIFHLIQVVANNLHQGVIQVTEDKIIENISLDLPELQVLPVGKQTEYVIKFRCDDDHTFVIKFYNLPFQDLILHTISINEVSNRISKYIMENGSANFIPLEIYGLGIMDREDRKFSFLIQDYCEYSNYSEILAQDTKVKKYLTGMSKKVSENGFVIDPSPSNYRVNYHKDAAIFDFYYLDLCFFNDYALRQGSRDLTLNLINRSNQNRQFSEYVYHG